MFSQNPVTEEHTQFYCSPTKLFHLFSIVLCCKLKIKFKLLGKVRGQIHVVLVFRRCDFSYIDSCLPCANKIVIKL